MVEHGRGSLKYSHCLTTLPYEYKWIFLVHFNQKERRDWGETGYPVRNGYKYLLSNNDLP
jgi:hypothetical protein